MLDVVNASFSETFYLSSSRSGRPEQLLPETLHVCRLHCSLAKNQS